VGTQHSYTVLLLPAIVRLACCAQQLAAQGEGFWCADHLINACTRTRTPCTFVSVGWPYIQCLASLQLLFSMVQQV
jgi:hypothetical protein